MSSLELTIEQQETTEALQEILEWSEKREYGYTQINAHNNKDVNNAITILKCMELAADEQLYYDVYLLSKQMRKDVRAAISKTLMEAYDSK